MKSPWHWGVLAQTFREASEKIVRYSFIGNRRNLEDRAADFTLSKLYCNQVYMLLIGISLENLLKGLIVEKDPGCVVVNPKTGDIQIESIKNHELDDLATKVERYYQLSLNSFEHELLERLASFVIGDGRYPVAKQRSKQVGLRYKPEDKATFEVIWDRLWPVLRKVIDAREAKLQSG